MQNARRGVSILTEFYKALSRGISHLCQITRFPRQLSIGRLRDKFMVTLLSLALFEIQAVCKAATESDEFRDPSDSSLIVPYDHLVTVKLIALLRVL